LGGGLDSIDPFLDSFLVRGCLNWKHVIRANSSCAEIDRVGGCSFYSALADHDDCCSPYETAKMVRPWRKI